MSTNDEQMKCRQCTKLSRIDMSYVDCDIKTKHASNDYCEKCKEAMKTATMQCIGVDSSDTEKKQQMKID